MERETIAQYLPHRPPMLLLDRVTNLGRDDIQTEVCLGENAPFFKGHFPDNPVVPGVIIVEAIAQSGALLAALRDGIEPDENLLAFAGIQAARFKRMVKPNETFCVGVQIVKSRKTLYIFSGVAKVDGEIAARVEFSAALIPSG